MNKFYEDNAKLPVQIVEALKKQYQYKHVWSAG